MQINITGHHIDVTEALRTFTSDKMGKLENHFDHLTNLHVILTVSKQAQKAEATVHVLGTDLFAQHETEDMYTSIDGLVHKLDRQIIKHKEKINDHHKKSGGIKNMVIPEED